MPDNPAKEAFDDLLTYLERLETQTGALLEFLRNNGTVTDEKLAPYLEQASKASDVRMRAARVRIEHLFSAQDLAKPATEAVPAPSGAESAKEKDKAQPQPAAKSAESKPAGTEEETKKPEEKQKTVEKEEPQPTTKDSSAKDSLPKEKEPSEIAAGREAAKHSPSKKEKKGTEDRSANPVRSDKLDKKDAA